MGRLASAMFHIALRFAALIVAALPLPALACSVADGYRVPTNLELAQDAELILLGKVMGVESGKEGVPQSHALLVQPLSAIKGELPAGMVKLPGIGLLADPRFLALSNPYDLIDAHPLSYIGGCIRYMFPQGSTVLFFLKPGQTAGSWAPSGGPFSRWAEDVPADGGPWTTLSAIYARAGTLPAADREALLESEHAALSARTDDPVALLMAADIARQIAGPNEEWNTQLDRARERDDGAGEGAAESTVDTTLDAMRRSEGK
ncbi:MAG: hypothetical protein EON59_11610 [Alphaproteobacteria bacterium]|nr:MAG: hypothetical protein EON59_11610 [Alphaproteobacteria bacterium]